MSRKPFITFNHQDDINPNMMNELVDEIRRIGETINPVTTQRVLVTGGSSGSVSTSGVQRLQDNAGADVYPDSLGVIKLTDDGNINVDYGATGLLVLSLDNVVLADGTVPLTANWDAGSYAIQAAQVVVETAADTYLKIRSSTAPDSPYLVFEKDTTTVALVWSNDSGQLVIDAYSGSVLLNSDTHVAAGKDLDCKTSGGYLKPRRLEQAAEPTPDVGELLMWCATTTTVHVYLMYNDDTKGAVKLKIE